MAERRTRCDGARKHHHEDIPWTVARCNRLLRSISSRINSIRRLAEANSKNQTKPVKQSTHLKSYRPSPFRTDQKAILLYAESPKGQDPEWMPQAWNTSSRTYGVKGRPRKARGLPGSPAGNSSNAPLRTPFLRKLLRPNGASPISRPVLQETSERASKKARQLPVKASTSLDEAHRSLVSAFSSFLNSSKPQQAPNRTGCRSFREMCLAKVPQYIEAEHKWRQDEDENDQVDPTDEIYSFLEGLGHGDSAGFAGLRQAVRSHGLRLIITAIEDGLFADGIVRQLWQVCRTAGAIGEGQLILQAWSGIICRTRVDESAYRLRMLVGASESGGCDNQHFIFRLLSRLLSDGSITRTHFAKLDTIWRSMLGMLSGPKSRLDAMQLLEAYILAPAQELEGDVLVRRRDSLWQVAAILTVLIWMQRDDSLSEPQNGKLAWQLQRILHVCGGDNARVGELRTARPFLLASLFISAAKSDGNHIHVQVSYDKMLELLSGRSISTASMGDTDLLLQVANVMSHVDQEAAFEMIRAIVLGMARVALEQSKSAHVKYLRSLAVDSAREWAEARDDDEIYDWAETVEDLFNTRDESLRSIQTPLTRKPSRYRWEAGINEWISATPFADPGSRDDRASEDLSDFDDSGVVLPDDESPSRKRSRSVSDTEHDSDLEDRDELSLQTPELVRLRDQRLRKAQKMQLPVPEKENSPQPVIHKKQHTSQYWHRSMMAEDLSEDELGL